MKFAATNTLHIKHKKTPCIGENNVCNLAVMISKIYQMHIHKFVLSSEYKFYKLFGKHIYSGMNLLLEIEIFVRYNMISGLLFLN